jgi:transposase InsO family protein
VPGAVLPPLVQHPSPNASSRHGIVPYLIVVHRPAGSFAGALHTLCDDSVPPDRRVSAHVLTDSNRAAAQLVPWDRKAWACAAFNAASYNVETDDDCWNGRDPAALATAARIVGFLCARTGIPAVWQRQPLHAAGIVRHRDLGRAGGGHSDPTDDSTLWRRFVSECAAEVRRGGYRPVWGVGELHRIDV